MLKYEAKTSGFIITNKPSGPTSHDIIDRLRKVTGIKKIGHAGTLDPFASGVLIVAIGRQATREIRKYVKLDKEYIATLRLGAVTDTYDKTGNKKLKIITAEAGQGNKKLEVSQIKLMLKSFTGEQDQVPPMYSAKKVKGKKLYELARQGIEVKRDPVKINIYNIELISYQWPRLEIKVRCTTGTYIRTLAHDIGQKLGCGAYLEELERTAIGKYKLNDSIDLERINSDNWKKLLRH